MIWLTIDLTYLQLSRLFGARSEVALQAALALCSVQRAPPRTAAGAPHLQPCWPAAATARLTAA